MTIRTNANRKGKFSARFHDSKYKTSYMLNKPISNHKQLNIMTKKVCILILILCGLLISCDKSNKTILNKSISKLSSIEAIEYKISLDIFQKEVGLDEIDTAICYFNFKSSDSLLGAKFHIVYNQGEEVFDGKKLFLVDKTKKLILYTNEPKTEQVNSSFFVTNSILLIKKLLPEFLKDTSIVIRRENDTLINGEKSYNLIFSIKDKNRYINMGAIQTEGSGKTAIYNLFISKRSYLPTQFIYVLEKNGYWKASFSNINLSIFRSDSIWEYDRFPQEYLRMSNKEFRESMMASAYIKIGQQAPKWSLPLVAGNSVQLSDLKGSLILLEFWFPYCGGCVQAIPEINTILNIYSNKNLKVYGIEFTQSDHKKLDDYIKKQNIEYPTLYKGQKVALEYGVNAAPTFFLINKKGIIVYSSIGLDKDELIKAIKDNIK
jgi:peroxiredoxin